MPLEKATIGTVEFQFNPYGDIIEQEVAITELKFPFDLFFLENLGPTAMRVALDAFVSGTAGKTKLFDLYDEMQRWGPLYIKTISLGERWGFIPLLRSEGVLGSTETNPMYRFRMHLILFGKKADFKLCTRFTNYAESNFFGLSGDIVVPILPGATNPTESVEFSRLGADGTTTPCILNLKQPFILYDATEANRKKGGCSMQMSGKEIAWHNQMIKIESRQAETSEKGGFDFYYWNGSTWTSLGRLYNTLLGTEVGNTRESLLELEPNVEPVTYDTDHILMKASYPETATSKYIANVYFLMTRGHPFVLSELVNNATTIQLKELELMAKGLSHRYWYRSGSVIDATGGVYDEQTIDGKDDTENFLYSSPNNPLVSTSEFLFITRAKKLDTKHRAHDAGNYWDVIGERFDNLTLKKPNTGPSWWIGILKKDTMGGRTPTNYGNETMQRIVTTETLRRMINY